jgi:hypothetical protein
MQVRRLNRVELLLPGEDIADAARVLNEVLGAHFPPPHDVPGQGITSTVDYALCLELFGPTDASSPRASVFDRKPRRGAIGPLVWEVDDLDAARADAEAKGFRVVFEFGEPGVRQLHLDPTQLFGYGVTITEHTGAGVGERPTVATRLHRVELLVPTAVHEPARQAFNRLFDASIAPPEPVEPQGVLASIDETLGIELFAPSRPDSVLQPVVEAKGAGAIGPIVFEVDDIDIAKQHAVERGYRVHYEFGAPGRRQVHLDASQLYGFGITYTERHALVGNR